MFHRAQAGEERDRFHARENFVRVVAFFQLVVWNPWAQVMDVVETDVASEPLQDLGKFVERAAQQRGGRVVPLFMVVPVNVLELVLHVEHPDASGTGDHRHGKLNHQPALPAQRPDLQARENRHGDIHGPNRHFFTAARIAVGEPLINEKQAGRGDQKQNDRIAHDPVNELFPFRSGEVFSHGEGPDVTRATTIQIAATGVVEGMFPAPMEIRSGRQKAGEKSNDVVRLLAFEKGTVAAIMKNDEDPN